MKELNLEPVGEQPLDLSTAIYVAPGDTYSGADLLEDAVWTSTPPIASDGAVFLTNFYMCCRGGIEYRALSYWGDDQWLGQIRISCKMSDIDWARVNDGVVELSNGKNFAASECEFYHQKLT